MKKYPHPTTSTSSVGFSLPAEQAVWTAPVLARLGAVSQLTESGSKQGTEVGTQPQFNTPRP